MRQGIILSRGGGEAAVVTTTTSSVHPFIRHDGYNNIEKEGEKNSKDQDSGQHADEHHVLHDKVSVGLYVSGAYNWRPLYTTFEKYRRRRICRRR